MRLCITSIIMLSLAISIHAQEMTMADAMKQINQIKLDSCYVWADCTSSDNADDAYKNAQALLKLEIQNWLSNQSEKDVAGAIMPTNDQCLSIKTMRGKLFRVFVYVDKAQIVPLHKNEKPLVIEREDIEPLPVVEQESPMSNATTQDIQETIYTFTDRELQMLQVKKATGIETYVKSEGISRFGKYKDRPQDGCYYLFVYDPNGNIPAYLKFDNGSLINVVTGKTDSFSNYKGCGAYWFILK